MSCRFGPGTRSAILRLVVALGLALGSAALADDAQVAAPEPDEKPAQTAEAKPDAKLNGFALTALDVPRDQLVAGGPGRDTIRSVDEPGFAPLAKATWVRADTPVIGVVIDGDARAYPIHIMEYHQIVNDRFAGKPVVVTYDPLTDTALAYRADGVAGADQRLEFGVSGLLYNCNFLLFDRGSDSLWSQMLGRAIAGRFSGRELERIPARVVSMARWVEAEPGTTVLERPALYEIDYRQSVYSDYWTSPEVPFPVAASDPRFHPKEVVLGVRAGSETRAYLGSILTRAGGRIVDDLAGRRIRVQYDGETATFDYDAPDDVQALSAYWFAWKAFHPDTSVWHEEGEATP